MVNFEDGSINIGSLVSAIAIVVALDAIIFPSVVGIALLFKFGVIKTVLGVGALLLATFGLVGFAMARGEEREGIWQSFKTRNLTRLSNEFKTRVQRMVGQTGVLLKWDIPEGREPKSFTENRLLLFALLDYSLRLDIFNAKRYNFDYIVSKKMTGLWSSLNQHYDRKRLRNEISAYRSGQQIGTFAVGWARFDKELLNNMKELLDLMYKSIRLARENRENPEILNIVLRFLELIGGDE